MKTTDKVISILFEIIKGSPLQAAISGKLRKYNRPAGSEAEDIVINCLPITGEQMQIAIANVNIYVPCFKAQENGIQTDEPNFLRLEQLTPIATELLRDIRKANEYHIQINQQQTIKDPDSASYIINFRLRFHGYNF